MANNTDNISITFKNPVENDRLKKLKKREYDFGYKIFNQDKTEDEATKYFMKNKGLSYSKIGREKINNIIQQEQQDFKESARLAEINDRILQMGRLKAQANKKGTGIAWEKYNDVFKNDSEYQRYQQALAKPDIENDLYPKMKFKTTTQTDLEKIKNDTIKAKELKDNTKALQNQTKETKLNTTAFIRSFSLASILGSFISLGKSGMQENKEIYNISNRTQSKMGDNSELQNMLVSSGQTISQANKFIELLNTKDNFEFAKLIKNTYTPLSINDTAEERLKKIKDTYDTTGILTIKKEIDNIFPFLQNLDFNKINNGDYKQSAFYDKTAISVNKELNIAMGDLLLKTKELGNVFGIAVIGLNKVLDNVGNGIFKGGIAKELGDVGGNVIINTIEFFADKMDSLFKQKMQQALNEEKNNKDKIIDNIKPELNIPVSVNLQINYDNNINNAIDDALNKVKTEIKTEIYNISSQFKDNNI